MPTALGRPPGVPSPLCKVDGSFPRTFVISLPGFTERRHRISQRLGALGVPFEFLDAVDGKRLAETDDRVDWEEVKRYPRWLNRGILGCALSHVAAYDRILQLRVPHAIILEDDCIPSRDFPQVLKHLPDQLTGSGVIMLFHSCFHTLLLDRCSTREVYGEYVTMTSQCVDGLQGTVAYAISYEAALRMRQSVLPIRVGPDSWGYFLMNKRIDTIRFVYPRCCDHDDVKSSIDYFGEAKLKRSLSFFIERYRIFPVYQVLKLKRRRLNQRMHRIQLV
jgi:GR25 family glycosyltransferase involved in LPS biosynthesis